MFTKRGDRYTTHYVLVSHYRRVNGRTILCVRDNNKSPRSNRNCENEISMKSDGSLTYNARGWGDLGRVEVAHNDDQDALAQFNSLRAHCVDEKDCGR